MTLVDLGAVVILLVYLLLGWTTGTVRRVIGLVIAFAALLVATNMGQPGGQILDQWNPTISPVDARLYSWLFFLLLILVALEAAATAVHARLQLAVVAFDKGLGAVLGALTTLVLVVALFYVLAGYSRAGDHPTQLQSDVRDHLSQSHIAFPIVRATAGVILPLLSAAVPRDSQAYFSFTAQP